MPDRMEYIKGLRELADFLEERPSLPVADYGTDCELWVSAVNWGASEEEKQESIRAQVADIAKAMGKADKKTTSYSFDIERVFSGSVRYRVQAARDAVCTPTKTVKETVVSKPIDALKAASLDEQIEALRAQKDAIPTEPRIELQEEITWSCEPLMKPRVAS